MVLVADMMGTLHEWECLRGGYLIIRVKRTRVYGDFFLQVVCLYGIHVAVVFVRSMSHHMLGDTIQNNTKSSPRRRCEEWSIMIRKVADFGSTYSSLEYHVIRKPLLKKTK